jgi:hypothetical protein
MRVVEFVCLRRSQRHGAVPARFVRQSHTSEGIPDGANTPQPGLRRIPDCRRIRPKIDFRNFRSLLSVHSQASSPTGSQSCHRGLGHVGQKPPLRNWRLSVRLTCCPAVASSGRLHRLVTAVLLRSSAHFARRRSRTAKVAISSAQPRSEPSSLTSSCHTKRRVRTTPI